MSFVKNWSIYICFQETSLVEKLAGLLDLVYVKNIINDFEVSHRFLSPIVAI